MFVILNSKGDVETEIDSNDFADVAPAASLVYPKHTTLYSTWDASLPPDHPGRFGNPAGMAPETAPPTPERAMVRSGLPWRPHAKRPGGGTGVGITMSEVLAEYPMGKNGLRRAFEALQPYFPHTPEEFGWMQWRTPDEMASNLLRSNAKTQKAIDGALGTGGVQVKPSYAVGVNVMPAGWGRACRAGCGRSGSGLPRGDCAQRAPPHPLPKAPSRRRPARRS